MIRVLVTSAGGSPAVNFTRSLAMSPEDYYIIGVDANKFSLERAEVNERHLVPASQDRDYVPVLQDIIRETHADLLHVQHSREVPVISKHRDKLGVKTFLPKHESVMICDNKMASFSCWKGAGLTVPETIMLNTKPDVDMAFRELGSKVWLRAITGSGGAGATPATDPEWAKVWVELHNGWGRFSAAKVLDAKSVIWQSIWKNGELAVAQSRQRLYWEFGSKFLSGVSGVTGAGQLVTDDRVSDIAKRAVLAIDDRPNGIWGVDLTYDEYGVPNPTEINAGRFFTTHLFFTEAGLNMPHIFVKLALGDKVPNIDKRDSPLPAGAIWIRGVDFLPVLTSQSKVDQHEYLLNARLGRIR